jgi:predicted ester cyclase
MNVPTGDIFRGPGGYRQLLEAWTAAMPNVSVEVENLIPADDWVTVECLARGAMTGELMMTSGAMMPPTGKAVDGCFCLVLHFRDGKIDRSRGYFAMSAIRGN